MAGDRRLKLLLLLFNERACLVRAFIWHQDTDLAQAIHRDAHNGPQAFVVQQHGNVCGLQPGLDDLRWQQSVGNAHHAQPWMARRAALSAFCSLHLGLLISRSVPQFGIFVKLTQAWYNR